MACSTCFCGTRRPYMYRRQVFRLCDTWTWWCRLGAVVNDRDVVGPDSEPNQFRHESIRETATYWQPFEQAACDLGLD